MSKEYRKVFGNSLKICSRHMSSGMARSAPISEASTALVSIVTLPSSAATSNPKGPRNSLAITLIFRQVQHASARTGIKPEGSVLGLVLNISQLTMDRSLYKDLTVSRGFTYHYYFSPAVGDKPYLLFIHGFPSSSQDWRFQVPFFREQGYGVIVPDTLGYGESSKVLNKDDLDGKKVAKDLVEILDAEKAEMVVAVGHDWSVIVDISNQCMAGLTVLQGVALH
jgi:hypothetical protein